uniref:Transmembrane protein n=1 Tax=Chromera velia CCMP2878 TaxID=1169474 RepID=A0A0G4GF59_9ALVE|eukprot:Cvel_21607.t1-p1 / transcript=Cvel_21607.t1 / gene=Cvel_21607 / organism=Chromera_velia_CCMP2878 / gene_product=hypothetical protein / transcript_product=hypothetical protein / location=Cvel_scaffold2041:481-2364(-) / protein_length=594 / sequence_SO=supercontig / SO=protein_coding / is_pseudo=false
MLRIRGTFVRAACLSQRHGSIAPLPSFPRLWLSSPFPRAFAAASRTAEKRKRSRASETSPKAKTTSPVSSVQVGKNENDSGTKTEAEEDEDVTSGTLIVGRDGKELRLQTAATVPAFLKGGRSNLKVTLRELEMEEAQLMAREGANRKVEGVHVLHQCQQGEAAIWNNIKVMAYLTASANVLMLFGYWGYLAPEIAVAVAASGYLVFFLNLKFLSRLFCSRVVLDARAGRLSFRGHSIAGYMFSRPTVIDWKDVRAVTKTKQFILVWRKGEWWQPRRWFPFFLTRQRAMRNKEKHFVWERRKQAIRKDTALWEVEEPTQKEVVVQESYIYSTDFPVDAVREKRQGGKGDSSLFHSTKQTAETAASRGDGEVQNQLQVFDTLQSVPPSTFLEEQQVKSLRVFKLEEDLPADIDWMNNFVAKFALPDLLGLRVWPVPTPSNGKNVSMPVWPGLSTGQKTDIVLAAQEEERALQVSRGPDGQRTDLVIQARELTSSRPPVKISSINGLPMNAYEEARLLSLLRAFTPQAAAVNSRAPDNEAAGPEEEKKSGPSSFWSSNQELREVPVEDPSDLAKESRSASVQSAQDYLLRGPSKVK